MFYSSLPIKFRVFAAILLALIQPAQSIRCYYCAEQYCKHEMSLRECPYMYTHCTAAQIDLCKTFNIEWPFFALVYTSLLFF